MPYHDIKAWDPPPKEPRATTLTIHTISGAVVDLPFERDEGGAFAFIQFLIVAIRDSPPLVV